MIGLLASLLVAAGPAPWILPDDPASWTRHPVSEIAALVTSMAIGDAGAAAGSRRSTPVLRRVRVPPCRPSPPAP